MAGHFDRFVTRSRDRGTVVVQPRMGFGSLRAMRDGLSQVASLGLPSVGTLTLDSYTRVGDYTTPLERLAAGEELNGYPLVSHPAEASRALLEDLHGPEFPVQVRHGTALPLRVFQKLVEVGLDATEGGPVSYCLPYSRLPLAQAVEAWAEASRYLAGETQYGHIESFGGCLLGQLCPPSLLVATAVLEGCFFRQHGLRHISLSFAQGVLAEQDRGALRALRTLAAEHLSGVDWHVVLYTYMGLFPKTPDGAAALIADSARLARDTGCERMIVKTVSEAWQIPTVAENLAALRLSAEASAGTPLPATALDDAFYDEVLAEARGLVETVLGLDPDVGTALTKAFARGILDIPFGLHPDNAGAVTSVIDDRGALAWGSRGGMPLPGSTGGAGVDDFGSERLHAMLNHVANRYDCAAASS
ncbi:methylaspartate mutase [Streptomyces goshikiensis]|uniref:methylaspartate mutase n=1 Tax=Streptomyces goshikiensis TaxID=1942 RepID=UPI003824608F